MTQDELEHEFTLQAFLLGLMSLIAK